MALTDKLTEIGIAIREKSGKDGLLKLDEMPGEIRALSAEEIIKHAEIPDYVKEAALEVANKVQAVRKDDSIVFLAMSDSHHYGAQAESGVDGYTDPNGKNTNEGNYHAAMAAKVLTYALNLDFAAHLGDATWGFKTTNSALLNSQIDELFEWLGESHKGIPCFHAIGNHDTGYYYHKEMVDVKKIPGNYFETGENLFNKFTGRTEGATFGNKQYGGYCYRDFTDKKLRVFLLNTSEYHLYKEQSDGPLGSQLKWFAEALEELNGKDNAADWSFIVLSHYPADYSLTAPLSNLLKAYVDNGSVEIAIEDGTKCTVTFSDETAEIENGAIKNDARFLAQFHGHIHNFLYSKLYVQQKDGDPVQFDAWRVCVPNGQFNRNNHQEGLKDGINFTDTETYNKDVDDKDKITAFVVNVVTPSEDIIHSFCYGAGIDRTIGIGETVYHSITNKLTNVVSDNTDMSWEDGQPYTATLIATMEKYTITSITVTMGGVDVTASVVADGVVSISAVTGNVIITATATRTYNVTNLLPTATDIDGTYYNGKGYKEDSYISGGNIASESGYYATGFIRVNYGDTLYFKNCKIQADQGKHRFAGYDDNKEYISGHLHNTTEEQIAKIGTPIYGSDGNIVSLTISDNYWSNVKYIRFCCSYLGVDSYVTINEPIE